MRVRIADELHGFLEPLLRFALSRAPDAEMAQDVVQESMLAALNADRRGRRWSSPEALWAWLTGVARNKLADGYRARQLAPTTLSTLGVDAEAIFERLDADRALPDQAANRGDIARLCQLALTAIAPQHRAVLTRFYQDGLSQRQLAHELGITEKALESRLTRARHALKGVVRRQLADQEAVL